MKKSRFTDSQIMAALKRAEGGEAVPELCREMGVSSATFYKWRSKFGGMDRPEQNACGDVVILPHAKGVSRLTENPMAAKKKVVYVIGAGLSAGLGFPTIQKLLPDVWPRFDRAFAVELAKIVRFHHPAFNEALRDSYPNIEQLLSELQANETFFALSRPASGNFTVEKLRVHRQTLLLEISRWFHELQRDALKRPPKWLTKLVKRIKAENATVISLNWDLVLDQLLFGDALNAQCYGISNSADNSVRLLKPHGSLNWFDGSAGGRIKKAMKFKLFGTGKEAVYAFRPFREPRSLTNRIYMPLIVPPVYAKEFDKGLLQLLWTEVTEALGSASEVTFIGFSLGNADFHARFILRCGFYNQQQGALSEDGERDAPTGRARVVIVDPEPASRQRVLDVVGFPCTEYPMIAERWMAESSPAVKLAP